MRILNLHKSFEGIDVFLVLIVLCNISVIAMVLNVIWIGIISFKNVITTILYFFVPKPKAFFSFSAIV